MYKGNLLERLSTDCKIIKLCFGSNMNNCLVWSFVYDECKWLI